MSSEIYMNCRYMGEGTKPYKPGGFHPVHLGDVLDGRYHVFRKLGSGGQSTVWLARDSSKQERSYVAIKVFEAEAGMNQEKIDQYLLRDQTPHPGAHYVESLSLGSFTVTGPNGTHYCKVLEPLGQSLILVLDEAHELRGTLNEGEGKSWNWRAQKDDGWLTAPAKKICWQVLSGLSYLHSRELAHRDIRPTNAFTALQYDLSSLHENEIQKSVWFGDEEEEEEEEEDEDDDEEDDDDEEGDDEDDDDDEGDDESDGDDIVSDPQERQRRKEERLRQKQQEEEEDRKWMESYYEVQKEVKKWDAMINAKWEAFGQGDQLAIPHSEEWNKANLTGTRDNIEILIRKDGEEIKPGELQYTVRSTPLAGNLDLKNLDLDKPFRVILGDLGYALPFAECSSSPIATEQAYRPPEDLLNLELTYKADVFSAGLFCWKVVMLDELIWLLHNSNAPDYTENRQLHDLARRLGPIPYAMRARWKEADKYIGKDGNALDLSESEKSMYGAPFGENSFQWGDIWHRARIQKPFDMSEGELKSFMDLIQQMLQWEPEKRPDVDEVLQHEWFKNLQ